MDYGYIVWDAGGVESNFPPIHSFRVAELESEGHRRMYREMGYTILESQDEAQLEADRRQEESRRIYSRLMNGA